MSYKAGMAFVVFFIFISVLGFASAIAFSVLFWS
jgi:hypothetical protein